MENRRRFLFAFGLLALNPLGSLLGRSYQPNSVRVQVRYFDRNGNLINWDRLAGDSDRWLNKGAVDKVINQFISDGRIISTYRHSSLAINEFIFSRAEDVDALARATSSAVRIHEMNALGVYRSIQRA